MTALRWAALRRRVAAAVTVAAVIVAAPGCGTAPGSSGRAPAPGPAATTVKVGDRPVTVHAPAGGSALPLVVSLHGYSSSGGEQESYLGIAAEAARRGFVYAYPDGTFDARGNRFWNATDACCDFYGSGRDDSRYLSEAITAIAAAYPVDPKRVYLIGHSNGAFMAFRMACDHADQVTAIAAFNGSTWQDQSRCRPSGPVSVLAIHGTADDTIAYAGGANGNNRYPSAERTAADWVDRNACTGTGTDAAPLDVVADLPGAETAVREVAGCAGGAVVRTWTIDGGSHVPRLAPAFTPAVLDFLLARSKP